MGSREGSKGQNHGSTGYGARPNRGGAMPGGEGHRHVSPTISLLPTVSWAWQVASGWAAPEWWPLELRLLAGHCLIDNGQLEIV